MSNPTPIDEAKVLATLEKDGLSWRDYFFVGEGDLLCFWEPTRRGLMAKIIEDDQLSRACKDYIIERGARRFADETALLATVGPTPVFDPEPS